MTQLSTKDSIILAVLLAATFLAGCSGLKPYKNTPDNNLHVHTAADLDS